MALGRVAVHGVQVGGVQLPKQWPSAPLDAEGLDKEDADRQKAVYLVTVAALQCFGLQQGKAWLVCPSRLSREDVCPRHVGVLRGVLGAAQRVCGRRPGEGSLSNRG